MEEKPKRKLWTQTEIDYLTEIAGNYTFSVLPKRYNSLIHRHNKKFGTEFPKRTRSSITKKLQRLGYSLKSEFDYFSVTKLAEILDMPDSTIRNWIRKNIFTPIKYGTKYGINRKDFKRFAKENKKFFSSCSKDSLFFLLEDQKLVEEILATPKRRKRSRLSV